MNSICQPKTSSAGCTGDAEADTLLWNGSKVVAWQLKTPLFQVREHNEATEQCISTALKMWSSSICTSVTAHPCLSKLLNNLGGLTSKEIINRFSFLFNWRGKAARLSHHQTEQPAQKSETKKPGIEGKAGARTAQTSFWPTPVVGEWLHIFTATTVCIMSTLLSSKQSMCCLPDWILVKCIAPAPWEDRFKMLRMKWSFLLQLQFDVHSQKRGKATLFSL